MLDAVRYNWGVSKRHFHFYKEGVSFGIRPPPPRNETTSSGAQTCIVIVETVVHSRVPWKDRFIENILYLGSENASLRQAVLKCYMIYCLLMCPMCAFSMCRNRLHLMHLRIGSNRVGKTGRYGQGKKNRQREGWKRSGEEGKRASKFYDLKTRRSQIMTLASQQCVHGDTCAGDRPTWRALPRGMFPR